MFHFCLIKSTNINKLVDVNVTYQVGNEAAYKTFADKFTYNATKYQITASISPTVLSVKGQETITLQLSSPVTNQLMAKIDASQVDLVTAESNQFTFLSPAMKPGVYEVSVWSEGEEENTRVVGTVEYSFYVTHFSPTIGSARGGTLLEIIGGGFSEDCQENRVSFGGYKCSVKECTPNGIKCQTSSVFQTHRIDNSGADAVYGPGFAWSAPDLAIGAGDTVVWSWQAPAFAAGVGYRVVQVQDAASVLETGFSSGDEATPVGMFSFQFNTPGTYYYWSDYVTSEKVNFRGSALTCLNHVLCFT